MKKILLVVLMVLIAGSVWAKSLEVTKKAGANTVTVTLQNDPPATGPNPVTVAVKDAAGKPVTNATVEVDYVMPAMPGMPAMKYKEPLKLTGQVYTGKLDFSMAGSWQVSVKVKQGGATGTVKFNTDVH
jgi:uncharacterized GH25 family protein